jgi:hypothetical protein
MKPSQPDNAGQLAVETLTGILGILNMYDTHGRRWLAALQAKNPDDPFPLPIGKRKGGYDLFVIDDVIAWVDRVAPCPIRYFNRLAQRFIRGEFDRPELQRQYQLKKIASRHCRRAA